MNTQKEEKTHGFDNQQKPFKTLDELKKSAERDNNVDAQYELAMRYYEGFGVAKYETNGSRIAAIDQEAVRLMTLAANQGHAKAQCFLGVFYDTGRVGVKQDQKEAVRLYQLSATQGYEVALFNLAHCYMHGEGVLKDEKRAVQLYKQAAEQNNYPPAQYNLGLCYENGTGVEKNYQKALDLFHLAAENGNEDAQHYLGNLYISEANYISKAKVDSLDTGQKYLQTGLFWLEKVTQHPTMTALRTENSLKNAGFWKTKREAQKQFSDGDKSLQNGKSHTTTTHRSDNNMKNP